MYVVCRKNANLFLYALLGVRTFGGEEEFIVTDTRQMLACCQAVYALKQRPVTQYILAGTI